MKAPRQDIYASVINRMVRDSLDAKNAAFASEHEHDEDDQLVAYVKRCASEIGHSPHQKEVIGWPFITARFGTWESVLHAADLPLPKTPCVPSQFATFSKEAEDQARVYREKKRQKKILAQKREADRERRKKECRQSPKR